MKYFKHDNDARNNPKVRKVLRTHGPTGYAIWWALLEELYKADEEGFQIEATELWLETIAESLCISDFRTLIRVFDTFASLNLIDPQLWEEGWLHAESIKERGDNYIQKKAANAKRQAEYRERQRSLFESESQGRNALRNAEKPKVTPSEDQKIRDQSLNTENIYIPKRDSFEELAHSDSLRQAQPPDDPVQSVEVIASVGFSGQKKNCAARPKSKKLNESGFERLRHVYNASKPDRWPRCEKSNASRIKLGDRLYQDCERDLDTCEQVLGAALAWAKLNPFWSGESGQYTSGSFETVFEKRRYQQWHERLEAQGLDSNAMHASAMSASDMQKAQQDYEVKKKLEIMMGSGVIAS